MKFTTGYTFLLHIILLLTNKDSPSGCLTYDSSFSISANSVTGNLKSNSVFFKISGSAKKLNKNKISFPLISIP